MIRMEVCVTHTQFGNNIFKYYKNKLYGIVICQELCAQYQSEGTIFHQLSTVLRSWNRADCMQGMRINLKLFCSHSPNTMFSNSIPPLFLFWYFTRSLVCWIHSISYCYRYKIYFKTILFILHITQNTVTILLQVYSEVSHTEWSMDNCLKCHTKVSWNSISHQCSWCSSSCCFCRMVSNTLSTFSGKWSRIMRGITASCIKSSAAAQRIANLDPLIPDFLYNEAEKYFTTALWQTLETSSLFSVKQIVQVGVKGLTVEWQWDIASHSFPIHLG